ncbi:MAG: NTP transferase domain-containing protein [Phycisphaerales bacterium]|nr:NTP transferase domain-containing protein [Phycisphaerales bacterium]
MSVTAIILAAGKSTRMKSKRPKVLHEICGKPMLGYVFDACFDAGVDRILAVVGHGKDEVIGQFDGDKRIQWVEQTEQLGTGHAARMCEKHLREKHGEVFILAGDGPLIRGEVLRTLLNAHHEERAAASMATAVVDNPTGYGRIVRDGEGNFHEIVEELDCTPQQREIHEIFPSYYCLRSDDLLSALGQLTPQNKKNEYYLTDVFSILRRAGRKVIAVQAVTAEDVLSINTRQQLAEVDAIMQDRIQKRIREGGVTIVSPINTYVEADVTIGPDTVLQPFCFIGRSASIGGDCVIGPMTMIPRQGIVPEGTNLAGNTVREAALG